MNILIDTNIFIPLETSLLNNPEPQVHLINEFYRKAKELSYHVFLIDVQKKDINNDKNKERKKQRLLAFEKYEILENIKLTDAISKAFPNISITSHDFVDISLLNALCTNAVSLLVTDDEGIHKKAKKINKEDVVYHLIEALDLINSQLPKNLKVDLSHPIIEPDKCYNLRVEDSFFDSLREDYIGFDNWFVSKCQKTHRDCLVIRDNEKMVGLCIYKFESPCYDMAGNILKICTFKLSSSGSKQGELLLKKIFDYCYASKVDWIYVTAFEKNYICQFFENFGFVKYNKTKEDTGELIFRKKMNPVLSDFYELKPLEFDIQFGPRFFNEKQDAFLVPIVQRYHDLLFPETIKENSLFPQLYYKDSFSNAIKKAYICKSNSSLLRPGAILFFYKSHDQGLIQACGIVERVERSQDPNYIISVTGKRTLYQRKDIEKLCLSKRNILILLFRQVEGFSPGIKLSTLKEKDLVIAAPQSITKLSEEAKKWILNQRLFS